MKILVTGGAGFIGTHLVRTLKDAGHTTDVLDMREPATADEWIRQDVRSYLVDIIKDYDAVYHLAAVANARVCGQRPKDAYEINVLGTYNVLEACYFNQIPRLIYASSQWVAGIQLGEDVAEYSPFELHRIGNIYGATKLMGEMMLISHKAERGRPDYTIARYGIPYGEGMWEGLVVRAFMLQAEKYGKITIFGDGLQGRNFLYVGDMCQGQAFLLEDSAANQIYNIGSADFITVNEIAEEVTKHFQAKIDYITQARIEPKLRSVSSDKMKQEFGWEPTTAFPDGITKCVEWWNKVPPDSKEDVPYYVP